MIKKLLKKNNQKKNKKEISHINQLRTSDFRVFLAEPYFNLDLAYEISWQKSHLKKLKHHAKNPPKFHRQFHEQKITEDRKRHFKEHVIDSIPFHKKILEAHTKRLKTILKIIPLIKYKKIVNISRRYQGTPEYFVYDKKNKDYFFVAEHLTEKRKHWIHLVRDKYKLCDVIILK